MSCPIILAHGICRFDHLLNTTFGLDNQDDDSLHYFRHIRSTLQAEGFEVYHASVGWADTLESRSAQLRSQILEFTDDFTTHARVNIIAHSMGGLDARHMLYTYRLEDRVASLITIGTPHHGSSFADWGVGRLGWALDFLEGLGIAVGGFEDLTSARCAAFNSAAADFEQRCGVRYQTVAGVRPRDRIYRPLRPSYDIIAQREGPNDGLVSLTSARWREDVPFLQIEADHLNQVGWFDVTEPGYLMNRERFEEPIRQLYVDLARGLPD